MILRFAVENYRSFRDLVELSYVSTSRRDEPTWRPNPSPVHAKHGVLPVLGIWGANASGKSNLVRALLELRDHVSNSFTALQPGQPVPWTPWHMSTAEDDPPTRMELDFLASGTRYHFGFRFSSRGFHEEWLFAFPTSRRRVLYHREGSDPSDWYFGPALPGPRAAVAKATRPNSLFLSTAAQHNHEDLVPVYTAIAQGIRHPTPLVYQGARLFEKGSALLAPEQRETVLKLLAAADLGVVDMRVHDVKVPGTELKRRLGEVFTTDFLDALPDVLPDGELAQVRLQHAGEDGAWELDPRFESAGTHVLLSRLEDLLGLLGDGGLLVLDELDTSLHPDMCGALVDLFTQQRSNPNGAQLLFTTHDRGLLTRLRTDEVVLLDKERDGTTRLRTASDYKGLRTRDDLRRAHEEGRLRGVPVLGDLADILAEDLEHGA